MKLQSDYGILDVRHGRKGLLKKLVLDSRGLAVDPIPVTITGFIDGVFGGDDGVSREFTLDITKVETSVKCASTGPKE